MDPTVEHDAREFGKQVRTRGWGMGLLVARCVEPRQGARHSTSPESGKVTQSAFAQAAGVNRETVALYLAAWNRAAEDGIVPPHSELRPGTDLDLDFDALPPWEEYYAPRGGWRSPDARRRYLDRQALREEVADEINAYEVSKYHWRHSDALPETKPESLWRQILQSDLGLPENRVGPYSFGFNESP